MTNGISAETNGITLLPCPFCGGEARIMHLPAVEPSARWHVDCANFSGCEIGPFLWRATEQEAIDAWNTRAWPSALMEVEKSDDCIEYVTCGHCGDIVGKIAPEGDYCKSCGWKIERR